MEEFSFEAIGTTWSIMTDGTPLKEKDRERLLDYINDFDQKFSRFLPESEAVRFRDAQKGEYYISEELTQMLTVAETLRSVTNGAYDPAVGELLEYSGYNPEYSFSPDSEKIKEHQLPKWSLKDTTLSLTSGVVFDIGGIGKGFCIDLVAEFLTKLGYQHFLIDAGGDMYATEKQDGSAFQIALEWPGKPGIAFGTIALKNRGLAVSDSFRRRWHNWHHIIDPVTKTPVQKIIGCSAVAKNAFQADCMTSGLFLAPEENYSKLVEKFQSEFVAFFDTDEVRVSEGWPGQFFE